MRCAEDAGFPKHQRDDHPAQSPIAIFERMQGLELGMRDGSAQQGMCRVVLDVVDQGHHRRRKLDRGDRDEFYAPPSLVADIVLLGLVVARMLFCPAPIAQQRPVSAADHVLGQRIAIGHLPLRLPQCPRVKCHFNGVIAAIRGFSLVLRSGFQQQDLFQCRNRPFHPR